MKLLSLVICGWLVLSLLPATPVFAQGRGNGGTAWQETHRGGHGHTGARAAADCPPGFARKHPRCVPPGQARKYRPHGGRVGEVLRIGDYILLRDPLRYGLDTRPGWDYYRDDRHIYRVDRDTRKVIAILDLIGALMD